MLVMVGADIVPAGRKPSRHFDGSLDPFLPAKLASPGQVLIDALPDQIGNGSPGRRRRMSKGFKLPVRQLHLSPNHTNMLSKIPSCLNLPCRAALPFMNWRLSPLFRAADV
jgi:hypothetical protein